MHMNNNYNFNLELLKNYDSYTSRGANYPH